MLSNKVRVKKPSVFLDSDSVQFCSRCKEYLSVGPVTILADKPLCGRCPDPKAVPADFYNKLAQYMYFPCINNQFGCNAMLAWGSAEAHEKICKFVSVVCPALTCQKKVIKEDIVDHFKNDHEELLVARGEFEAPSGYREKNSLVNKLMVWGNQVFILKINFSSASCFFSVSNWDYLNTRKLKYNILLEDADRRRNMQMRDLPVVDYKTKRHENSVMTELDITTLKKVLNTKTLFCTVKIGQESGDINENLLSELECPVCLEYMRPPIFMCAVGHSICSSCKIKVKKCPMCQIPLNSNRNFALEKVTEHIFFPCKNRNRGCCFAGPLMKVSLHESICFVGAINRIKCYMNHVCGWKGPISEMTSHLIHKHPNFYFDLHYSVVFTMDDFSFLKVYTEYNGQIFKLYISQKLGYGIQFGVKLIKNNSLKDRKYQFHIDFEDLEGNNKLLRVTGDCTVSKFNDDNFNLSNSIVIHKQLVRPFVKDNVVEFRINLVEC
ncbi:uncharacterized protein [Leptinotarsa decemlineata]|uniref:uncharacterized protein n=1 Tax=Leptinotarsa decemlineata TaxID=7539 RepID=UPI003D309D7E